MTASRSRWRTIVEGEKADIAMARIYAEAFQCKVKGVFSRATGFLRTRICAKIKGARAGNNAFVLAALELHRNASEALPRIAIFRLHRCHKFGQHCYTVN